MVVPERKTDRQTEDKVPIAPRVRINRFTSGFFCFFRIYSLSNSYKSIFFWFYSLSIGIILSCKARFTRCRVVFCPLRFQTEINKLREYTSMGKRTLYQFFLKQSVSLRQNHKRLILLSYLTGSLYSTYSLYPIKTENPHSIYQRSKLVILDIYNLTFFFCCFTRFIQSLLISRMSSLISQLLLIYE